MVSISSINTEQRNPATLQIDRACSYEIVRLMNAEDKKVAEAVEHELPKIAAAVDVIYRKLKDGGRLIYCGCGTSGRLGALDAAECPPTFGVNAGMVQAVLAGGPSAMTTAVEGAEDCYESGRKDLETIGFGPADVLVGIAASGRTPYVLGAMDYAKSVGADVIGLTCCPGSEIDQAADIGIAPLPGPEVVTGSTRLKSGTAQKMVLNMLSTATMIRLGKVYSNLMVDVNATNEKLVARAVSIVRAATGVGTDEAQAALEASDYSAKKAIIMLLCGVGTEEAETLLSKSGGNVSDVVRAQAGGEEKDAYVRYIR